MKTLKQLWEENNCQPFWARNRLAPIAFFYMQGLSLDGETAIGSTERGIADSASVNFADWTLCDDPRKPKPKEKLVLWRCTCVSHHVGFVGSLLLLAEGVDPSDESLYFSWDRVSLSELLEGE
jgi:hypothetical protein